MRRLAGGVGRRGGAAVALAAGGLALGVLHVAAAAAAEKAAPSAKPVEAAATWYAQSLTVGDTPLRFEHFWSKGRRLRAETVVGGMPLVTLVHGEFYTVIDPMRLEGIAVRRSPAALLADRERASERPFGTIGRRLVEQGAELLRREEIAGRTCKVYRLTDTHGRREVWLTDDELGLPLRLVQFDRATGAEVRTEFVDWTRELELPDAFFEPDPRVRLERIEYEDYVRRSRQGPVGPAPPLYGELLHGR
jgi:outer membrane lipoprotein-sorting protein